MRVVGRDLSKGRFLAAICLAAYFLLVWKPPVLGVVKMRWFMAVPFAAMAFALQRRGLMRREGNKLYWTVAGLCILGAILSLTRAEDVNQATARAILLAANYCILWLFLPVLSTRMGRRVLLVALILSAGLWVYEIRQLLLEYRKLLYSSFEETGSNKNLIGFNLVLAGTALLYMSVFWRPDRWRWSAGLLRVVMALCGINFLYHMALIYARSGILAGAVGVVVILFAIWILKPDKRRAIVYMSFVAAFVVAAVVLLLPRIIAVAPEWKKEYEKALPEGRSFQGRQMLIEKGFYLVSENPFIGVGVGGSVEYAAGPIAYPHALIHNAFLTDWVELGLCGLLADLVWIGFYVSVLRRRFVGSPMTDQVWLVLYVPLFFEMNFIDMNTVATAMLALLGGLSCGEVSDDQKVSSLPLLPGGAVGVLVEGRSKRPIDVTE